MVRKYFSKTFARGSMGIFFEDGKVIKCAKCKGRTYIVKRLGDDHYKPEKCSHCNAEVSISLSREEVTDYYRLRGSERFIPADSRLSFLLIGIPTVITVILGCIGFFVFVILVMDLLHVVNSWLNSIVTESDLPIWFRLFAAVSLFYFLYYFCIAMVIHKRKKRQILNN